MSKMDQINQHPSQLSQCYRMLQLCIPFTAFPRLWQLLPSLPMAIEFSLLSLCAPVYFCMKSHTLEGGFQFFHTCQQEKGGSGILSVCKSFHVRMFCSATASLLLQGGTANMLNMSMDTHLVLCQALSHSYLHC